MSSRYNLRNKGRSRANSLPVSPNPQKDADSPLSVPPPSEESTRSANAQEDQNETALRRYSDVVRGSVLPLNEAFPDLRITSSVPGSRSTSPVGPSSKLCSPVFLGHEHESSPMMPGDLRVPVGRKQTLIATHLEVMAVIHTESGSDGLPSNGASESTPEDGNNKDDNLGWTTVSRKGQRTRSASREKRRRSKVLDDELNHVVREAKRGLTPNDRVRINKRITALKNRPAGRQGDETSETTSRGEGPSALDKGKGIDPRNWGALSENGDDLDLDGQRAALESWNLARDIARSSTADSEEGSSGSHLTKKNKHEQNNERAREVSAREVKPKGREQPDKPVKNKHQSKNEKRKDAAERRNLSPVKAMVERAVTLSDKPRRRHHTPKAMEPVEQIDPNSYIGLAFKRLERKRKPTGRRHQKGSSSSETNSNSSGSSDGLTSEDDDSSDSNSGSSDSSSASDEMNSSSSSSTSRSSDHRRRRRRNCNRHRGRSKRRSESRRARRKSRRKSRKMTLKPIPPNKYDGSADSKAFHRFMTESTAYVKDGNVPEKKQVFIVAHYLTGKGRTFYSEEVAIDPYSWCIREFFKQLFNFCFPVNYRNQQRDKVATFMQNSLTVREYLHELNEMWNTIGERNDQLKVDKFWKGLRKDYQRDLWKDKLNPEVSTLKEVVAAAEVIEIS